MDTRMTARNTAIFQGSLNLLTGLWPIVHMRSFEAVSGYKRDKWLVRTVGGLLATIGSEQLSDAFGSAEKQAAAKRLGIGTAATLAAIDLTYVAKGKISKIYLLDAAVELLIIRSWLRSR